MVKAFNRLLIVSLSAIISILIHHDKAFCQPSLQLQATYYNYAIWDAAYSDSLVYIACGENGLVVLDVTDPSDPMVVSEFDTPGFAKCLKIQGNYVIIADLKGSGIRIVDVSNPESPFEAGVVLTEGNAFSLAIQGDIIYVADGKKGISIIDYSDPVEPELIGNCPDIPDALGIDVQGNYAYVSAYLNGLYVVDVSVPAAPFITGHLDLPPVEDFYPGLARNVCVRDTIAYVADYGCGLRIVDITNSQAPELIFSLYLGISNVYDVDVEEEYAFVANEYGGLDVVDVSEPTSPFITSEVSSSESIGVHSNGNLVFLCGLGKLRIYTFTE